MGKKCLKIASSYEQEREHTHTYILSYVYINKLRMEKNNIFTIKAHTKKRQKKTPESNIQKSLSIFSPPIPAFTSTHNPHMPKYSRIVGRRGGVKSEVNS